MKIDFQYKTSGQQPKEVGDLRARDSFEGEGREVGTDIELTVKLD